MCIKIKMWRYSLQEELKNQRTSTKRPETQNLFVFLVQQQADKHKHRVPKISPNCSSAD